MQFAGAVLQVLCYRARTSQGMIEAVHGYVEDPSNLLTARYQPDWDGTGELRIRAAANGFSGESTAWFDTLRLIEFATALDVYPLPSDSPLTIASGFLTPGTSQLEQEHVGLVVQPIGAKGQIRVRVHLSTPLWPATRSDSVNDVRLELLTTYQRLHHFSVDFAHLLRAEVDEARLGAEILI
jgi:hypothetical protein